MALLVQKYGGSSLTTAGHIRKVARRIGTSQDKGDQVVAVVSAMGDTTDQLISLAHQISPIPDEREMDVLLSTGELVSCTLMAMALRSIGYKAISLSGAQAGIRTDTVYGRARIASVDPRRIHDELEQGRIVIVAGFQGITEDLDITTLGRGGSDTTAVALAASLGAARCEIYTDVEGIYTTNPRLVPKARKLKEIGYEEMLELASYGAKMHPRSIELGILYNIPIVVASTFSDEPGTIIHGGADMTMEVRNKVRGIAIDTNVAKITILGVIDRPGIASTLFDPLAEAGISVDVIVQNASVEGTTDLTFTVSSSDLAKALEVVEPFIRDLGGRDLVSSDKLAKVTIVGTGMQNAPGYASRMFRALYQANINIEMITTSEIRITCIIERERVAEAAQTLHSAFELEEE